MTSSPKPPHEPHPNHDRGLEFDLSTLMSRRSLGMFLGAGTAAALAACTPGGSSAGAGPPAAAADGGHRRRQPPAAAAADGHRPPPRPTLTRAIAECGVGNPAGDRRPVPGDGSNGPNVLAASGVVRQDITSSFGTSTATAEGVPLTVTLTLLDNANGCAPLAGAAVYAWHCDREGKYSMYDSGLKNENYLRGVQEADANGQVTFTDHLSRRATADAGRTSTSRSSSPWATRRRPGRSSRSPRSR